jgi:RimJ/RimL family protein N-acetyltransferase
VTEEPSESRFDLGDARIATPRLLLAPLSPDDAEPMVDVLSDPGLYAFIGGEPATLEELQARYRQLVAGPPRANELWLNWIIRQRVDDQPIGTVQATLVDDGHRWRAEIAWVIGVAWQRHGFATEAARALVEWLWQQGVAEILANIHPDHRASELVASRAGLRPTTEEVDGERVWRADGPAGPAARAGEGQT